jgi:plastocyanin
VLVQTLKTMNRTSDGLSVGQWTVVCGLAVALMAPAVLWSADWNVSIVGHAFVPSEVTIEVNDRVIWTQGDVEQHTTTSDTGVWNSPFLSLGQTFPHVFTAPGTFPYHCIPHPAMRGRIIVQPAASTGPTVEITSPESGVVLTVPGSVRLEASTSEGTEPVVQVEFFNGETSLGIVPNSPHLLAVNLGAGEHSITAVVKDRSGATAVSDPVVVTVEGVGPVTTETELEIAEASLEISWNEGAGPFVVQRTATLNDPEWTTEAAVAGRAQSSDVRGDSAFFRIADVAEHEGIPFTTFMSGAAVRPDPVTTDAMGSGIFRLEGRILTFNVWYEGLSGPATAAHVHGPASASGPETVLIDLEPYSGGESGNSGSLSGQIILSPEQQAMVLAGRTYVNVHTQQHPDGELRGQIAPVLHQVHLNGAKERPDPVETSGKGFGTLLLVGNKLVFQLDYIDLSGPATAAHIHGPAGSEAAADVLVDLRDHATAGFGTAGTLMGKVILTPDQLAWLIDGQTYINVHTMDHTPGEIRGQILPQILGTPLTATLSGEAERPDPVATGATGSGLFRLEGDALTFNVRYDDLSGPATMAHFHGPATAGTAADVLVDLEIHNGTGFGSSGILSGRVLLDEEQQALVRAGMAYVNVHTEAHPNGEIRGQIAPVLHRIRLSGANERPDAVETTGSGIGSLLLVGNELAFHLNYKDLVATADAAHVHGPATTEEAADVLIELGSHVAGGFGASGALMGTVPLDADPLAWLIDGLTYVNVHTSAHDAGEIRGQITR